MLSWIFNIIVADFFMSKYFIIDLKGIMDVTEELDSLDNAFVNCGDESLDLSVYENLMTTVTFHQVNIKVKICDSYAFVGFNAF